jgi:hypothetical protein
MHNFQQFFVAEARFDSHVHLRLQHVQASFVYRIAN